MVWLGEKANQHLQDKFRGLVTAGAVPVAAVVSICRFATVRSQAGLVMKAASLSFVGRPRAVHRTSSSGPAVRAKLRTSATVAMVLSSVLAGPSRSRSGVAGPSWKGESPTTGLRGPTDRRGDAVCREASVFRKLYAGHSSQRRIRNQPPLPDKSHGFANQPHPI